MNTILKIEKWLYIHLDISLPLWRKYHNEYTRQIQEELDASARARILIDSLGE